MKLAERFENLSELLAAWILAEQEQIKHQLEQAHELETCRRSDRGEETGHS